MSRLWRIDEENGSLAIKGVVSDEIMSLNASILFVALPLAI